MWHKCKEKVLKSLFPECKIKIYYCCMESGPIIKLAWKIKWEETRSDDLRLDSK